MCQSIGVGATRRWLRRRGCAVGQVAVTATFLLIMVNLARSIEETCGLEKPNVPRGRYARAVT